VLGLSRLELHGRVEDHARMPHDTQIDARAMTVRALKRKFERGVFAIPELQREFVWKESKVPQLLDSMYRGFPIGAALVWKTERRNQHLLRKKLHILPDFHPSNSEIWYLIDGQQRLSVLWQLVRDPTEPVTIGSRSIDFRSVYFRLRPEEEDEALFVFRRRAPDNAVRVVDILSDRWRSRLRQHGVRDLRRIEQCRRRLLEYPVWLMFVDTNDLHDVRDTFVRINSLGTPIRTADRAFARAADVDLRGLVRELQAHLKHGFAALSEETILQTAGLLLGSKDVGARAIDRLLKQLDGAEGQRTVRRLWARLDPAFMEAVDYLGRNFGIFHHRHLPSETMVAVLAAFFYYSRRRRPSPSARRQIHHWFWATAVGARYTGRGFRENLVRDFAFMRRLAERGTGRFTAELVPAEDLLRADYSRAGALANSFFCLLRVTEPRYLQDGELIPVEKYIARGNRSDKHHIFPKALLRRAGVPSRRINSLPNVCLLVARENQSVGSKHPAHYLRTVPHGGRARSRAAQSHLIPIDAAWMDESNVKRSFNAFTRLRAALIVKRFHELAGARLFTRG
jgi:hypothetical protein